MAKATPCPVPEGLSTILSGYDFADSFQIAVPAGRFDARSAAHQALDRGPLWVGTLLGLRNLLVAPFGLRGTGDAGPEPRIGWFPQISESPERVVLGFDDKHLDFRIVIDHEVGTQGLDRVRASTLVRRHNLGGRLYLASILPFHKLIVPHMLNKLG
jgi:Protein of unknown function (DUF2867)